MYDVVALGELLIDFTQSGLSEQGNPLFEANPGGAPCNVLAMLARLRKSTAFIGKVGQDMFGGMLREVVREVGIDDVGLVTDADVRTTLAFVHTAPDGDRDFSFFRNPGADIMLRAEEVDTALLQNTRVLHFGSLSLTHEPARSATKAAVETAKAAGALLSFDPNLREPLWPTLDDARAQMEWGCAQADILKIAEEELSFLCGASTIKEGVAELRRRYPGLRIIFVTKGKAGAEVFYKELHAAQPSFLEVATIDTTGAGDTFCGCCLAGLLDMGLDDLSAAQLNGLLRFANAAASIVTTRYGAIRAMPTRKEVERLMEYGIV